MAKNLLPFAVSRSLIDAINRHDPVATAACYAEDGLLLMYAGARVSGREAIVESFRNSFTAFPDYQLEPLKLIAIDEKTCLCEYTVQGTFLGPLRLDGKEFAPNGRFFKAQYAATITVDRTGLVAGQVIHGDPFQQLGQLGLVPNPFVTPEKAADHVRRMVEAMNSLDAPAVAAFFHENAVFGSPVLGEFRGRAAIEEAYAKTFATYPEGKVTLKSITADETAVVATINVRAVNKGPFASGKAATGREIDTEVVLVAEVGGAGILKAREYVNEMAIAQQLGLIK